jgi:AraC-like DNA-binding protein
VIPEKLRHRQDPVEQTVAAIKALLTDQRASLSCTAGRMRMHKSMLKSLLRRRDLHFSGLRDNIRFQLAADYLAKSNVHIAEIGMLVGFSEESSFFRAFKRWSGETPGAYRRRAKAVGSTSSISGPAEAW